MPVALVDGYRLPLLGGEIDRAVVEGQCDGHHPNLCLTHCIQAAGRP